MSASSLRTLIVDSDELSREQLRAKLRRTGVFVSRERPHGLVAQQTIQDVQPHLIFVAIEQPIQRALQTVDFARAVAPDSMIIAYSAEWSPIIERRLMQSGVNDFLHGNISSEQLEAVAARAIRKADASGAAAGVEQTGRVIAVVGQKGGIGKTTTSTNLAASIAMAETQSVLVIDLDTRFGDVAIMLDVRAEYTVAEAARDLEALDHDTFRRVLLRHESGAYVLPAPRGYRSWLNCSPEEVRDLIRFAASIFDVVIVDTPGAFSDLVAAAVDVADRVIVVTSAELPSVKNTSLLLEHFALKAMPDDQVLVTLIHGHDQPGPARADVEFGISHVVNHEIPFDRAVRKSSELGIPIVMYRPSSSAAVAFTDLAADVSGLPVGLGHAQAHAGLRRRFFAMFGLRRPGRQAQERGEIAV